MDQQCALVEVHAAPVRAAVALALRQFQRVAAQGGKIVTGLQAEDSEDRTHGGAPVGGFHGWEGVRPAIQARVGLRPGTKKPASADAGFLIVAVVVDGGGQADRHGIDPTPVSGTAQQLRRQPAGPPGGA
ncbi:hypothetical protein G6F22_012408 [Rhizopus arrhizus]|nr:hypothetical protein G6F22_012408 [Rhizopus arrhizus]